MRERWALGARADAARINDGIFDKGVATGRAAEVIAFDNALETNRRIYVDPTSSDEVKAKAKADIEGAIQMGQETGLLDPVDAENRREAYIRKATVSGLLLKAEQDPGFILGNQQQATSSAILSAIRQVESGGNTNAESGVGASGSMQVMPATGIEIARELNDTNFPMGGTEAQIKAYLKSPGVSERYGEHYFDKMLRRYNGDTEAALVAYNGGPARGDAWVKSGKDDSVIPAETRDYYKKVLAAAGGPASDSNIQPSVRLSGLPGFAQANSFLKTRIVNHGSDHIDGLQTDMQQRLAAFIQSAPPGMAEKLGIFSGARTVARQTELWNEALKKYGSAGEARKWVAPPPGVLGSKGSNHNSGAAADLSYDGKSLANAPPEVVKWAHENAGRFGLAFPLSNENWHVEMVEARGGGQANLPAWASEVSPEDRMRIMQAAQTRQNQINVENRGAIDTVVQNAPSAIQNTGAYSGQLPSQQQFIDAYGPQDGQERYDKFQASIDVSQQAHDFRTMSSADIEQAVKDATPTSSGNDAALQASKYSVLQDAAATTLKARNADPSGYTQAVFPSVAQAWQQAQESGDYQSAMAQTAAAQRQLGIANMQLLPKAVAETAQTKFKDENLPEQERIGAVAGLIFSTADPEQRLAVFDQLVKSGLPDITAGAIRATARGDTGAAQRLFEAAMVDVSKLPGALPGKITRDKIDETIQSQLMDVNQIGDVYYGLSDGSAENMVAAQRDSKLMTNAVTLRVRKGENLDSAVNAVAKDLFGDVKPISGANVSILIPSDQDERVVTTGLDAMQPKVRQVLEQTLAIPGEVKGADNALMNATRANEINRLMLDGYWRNAGDGFAFLDPKTGMAVAGPDGNPLIFSEKEVLAAGSVPRETRRKDGAVDPAQPLTDDAFTNFQNRMGAGQ